jgi:hypothetical protein
VAFSFIPRWIRSRRQRAVPTRVFAYGVIDAENNIRVIGDSSVPYSQLATLLDFSDLVPPLVFFGLRSSIVPSEYTPTLYARSRLWSRSESIRKDWPLI